MNRSGVGEVQIDHILYAVLQLTAHTEVKSNASSIFIIFDIADESQVAIGYLGSVFGLHDPVIDPEYLDADFDFFLGGTKRVDHFADRFVELFRRGRAVRAERRQNLHPVNPTFLDLPAVAGNNSFSGFRLIAAEQGIVIAASYWGKFKTTFQMIAVILMIVDLPVLHILTVACTWIALVLTVVSLVDYIAKNHKVLTEGAI